MPNSLAFHNLLVKNVVKGLMQNVLKCFLLILTKHQTLSLIETQVL